MRSGRGVGRADGAERLAQHLHRLLAGAPSTAASASTQAGSNVVAVSLTIWAIARSWDHGSRYARRLISASYTSQTVMMRASSGIAWPAMPSGYPPPPNRS